EACRHYLLLIAQQELAPDLRAKGGASDLVQQTFLEAYRDFAHFQGTSEAELLAWLRQLLLHRLGKLARSYRHTQKRALGCEVSLDAGDSSAPAGLELAADLSSPSGQAMANEQAQALQRALDLLPEDYQRVIRLRYQEERSFAEIGQLMQRSAEAARKLWWR